ncbi:MAG TPA: hypothetical protein ENG85_00285 [Bacteroidetes bacterium]|nr:hypothetical protein [Bacteroidota bacterium]
MLSPVKGSSSSLTNRHLPEVCSLSGRIMFQPVSIPLQNGFCFLQILLSAYPTACLAVSPAHIYMYERIYGLTTFRLVTTDNLDPSRTPVEQRSRMATLESHTLSTNLFGLSLPVWLARFFLTTLQMFAYADLVIPS